MVGRRRSGRGLVALVLGGGLLVACGGDGVAAPSTPSTTRTVTVTAEPAPASEPAAAPTSGASEPSTSSEATQPPGVLVDEVSREAEGPQPYLVAARVGAQPGYDRVVWEFAGPGTPGYRIGWTDDPRRDGSGEVVDLAGDATLQVAITGVGFPPDAPDGITPYEGAPVVAVAGTTVVTEVLVGSWFEAYVDGFVGARERRPFEVTLLRDPTRLVVDVRH